MLESAQGREALIILSESEKAALKSAAKQVPGGAVGGMLTQGHSPWAGAGLARARDNPLSPSCPSDRPAGAEEP